MLILPPAPVASPDALIVGVFLARTARLLVSKFIVPPFAGSVPLPWALIPRLPNDRAALVALIVIVPPLPPVAPPLAVTAPRTPRPTGPLMPIFIAEPDVVSMVIEPPSPSPAPLADRGEFTIIPLPVLSRNIFPPLPLTL